MDEVLYTATIHGQPITKKNSQRIVTIHNKPRIIPSKAYKDYEYAASVELGITQRLGYTINEPVNVQCTYYMGTKRKADLTNLLEATDDVLVRAGILYDDNYGVIQSHDGSRVLIDRENPRVEIVITRRV
jgi:Holliday junction resolvase RusA-like endonuclease